jgi:hypothetical protein
MTAAPTAAAATAAPASTQTDPKVLHIVTTGFGISLTPTEVEPARYTVQVLNIGQYAVHVTIGKSLDVVVPPGGWRFHDVLFKPGASYKVHAVASERYLTWDASFTASK